MSERREPYLDGASPAERHRSVTGRSMKRRRVKLTCLNCKRRKTKCDKVQPCASCKSHGEDQRCTYDEGVTPEVGAQVVVSRQEFLELKSRINDIEAKLTVTDVANFTGNSGSISFSDTLPRTDLTVTSKGRTPQGMSNLHAKRKERAFNALEGFAATVGLSGTSCSGVFSPQATLDHQKASRSWPDISLLRTTSASGRWIRDMTEVLDTIPNLCKLKVFIDYYFYQVQYMRYYLNETVFRAEVDQFETMRYTSQKLAVDPAWLAILTGVIWVVCHYLLDEDSLPQNVLESGLNMTDVMALAEVMFDSFQTVLVSSSWMIRPQFRVLQFLLVVLALNQQLAYNAVRLLGPRVPPSHILWYDVAVGISKALHLNTSTTIVELEKLGDPALRTEQPLYSVETARQVFSHVLLLDTFNLSSAPGAASSFFPLNSFTTPDAKNYSETALIAGEPGGNSPPWEKTGYIWEFHINIIARIWRRIVHTFREEQPPSNTVIMELDGELRRSLADLCKLNELYVLDARDLLAFKFMSSSYHQRFLRLHRSHLLRGYEDEQYRYSQQVVLKSAHEIVDIHRLLLQEHHRELAVRYALYLFVHHITALVVFFVHALYRRDELGNMRQQLTASCNIFLKVSLEGHKAFTRGSSKAYSVTVELLSVLDNPPDKNEDLVEVLNIVKTKAVAAEAILIQSRNWTASLMDAGAQWQLPVGNAPVIPGGTTTDATEAWPWDFDWLASTQGI